MRFSLSSSEVRFSKLQDACSLMVGDMLILVLDLSHHPKSSGRSVSDMSLRPRTERFFSNVIPWGSLQIYGQWRAERKSDSKEAGPL